MNFTLYREYLREYLTIALRESDGSNRGIAERLGEFQVRGLIVRHRDEKLRALSDARQAFDEHRHWPLEIVLSQLGFKREELA
jgi:hypothetical protein